MSSSEDSVVCTDSEYEMEAESDLNRKASPVTSDDEVTAFADDPRVDAEWTAQYEQEIEKEKELEQELTKRLQGATHASQSMVSICFHESYFYKLTCLCSFKRSLDSDQFALFMFCRCKCGNCSVLLLQNICECYCCSDLEGCLELTKTDLVVLRYRGRRYPKVRYAAPRIQSRLSPEMESEVGCREIQDERKTTVQTERK